MHEDDLPAISAVQRLRLKPDDMLVVSCSEPLTDQRAQRLKERVAAQVGIDASRVLVLGAAISISRLNVEMPRPVVDGKFIQAIIAGIRREQRRGGGGLLV